MPGTASDPFFWNDYQGDPCLRACGFAAQGLWMRMLCVMAEATPKGMLLVKGKKPSVEELTRIVGGTSEEVAGLLSELSTWGVYSTDRRGVIYSRAMIKRTKKEAASRKGGKKGGPVSLALRRGIHATRDTTRDATRTSLASPPIPIPSKKESKSLFNAGVGWEKGRGSEGRVTIKNPDERMHRFIVSLSRELDDPGMVIIAAAIDANDENHVEALALCKNAAQKLGKGWPRNWPTDHSIFERLTSNTGDRAK